MTSPPHPSSVFQNPESILKLSEKAVTSSPLRLQDDWFKLVSSCLFFFLPYSRANEGGRKSGHPLWNRPFDDSLQVHWMHVHHSRPTKIYWIPATRDTEKYTEVYTDICTHYIHKPCFTNEGTSQRVTPAKTHTQRAHWVWGIQFLFPYNHLWY